MCGLYSATCRGPSAVRVLSALRGMHRGYVEADRLMGSCASPDLPAQMSCHRKGCEVAGARTRIEMLRFACQFAEFGGWIFQMRDLTCAMRGRTERSTTP